MDRWKYEDIQQANDKDALILIATNIPEALQMEAKKKSFSANQSIMFSCILMPINNNSNSNSNNNNSKKNNNQKRIEWRRKKWKYSSYRINL